MVIRMILIHCTLILFFHQAPILLKIGTRIDVTWTKRILKILILALIELKNGYKIIFDSFIYFLPLWFRSFFQVTPILGPFFSEQITAKMVAVKQ